MRVEVYIGCAFQWSLQFWFPYIHFPPILPLFPSSFPPSFFIFTSKIILFHIILLYEDEPGRLSRS